MKKKKKKKKNCHISFFVCVLKVIYDGENDQVFIADNLATS